MYVAGMMGSYPRTLGTRLIKKPSGQLSPPPTGCTRYGSGSRASAAAYPLGGSGLPTPVARMYLKLRKNRSQTASRAAPQAN